MAAVTEAFGYIGRTIARALIVGEGGAEAAAGRIRARQYDRRAPEMARDAMGTEMRWKKRQIVVVSMMLLIAAAHIIGIGDYLPGELYKLYYSYFSDFIMPFGFYFLFCMAEQHIPVLRRWQVKLGVTFLLPATAETLQFFGVNALGITFDPLDYLMYATGATSAAIVDTQVFARVFDFWGAEKIVG